MTRVLNRSWKRWLAGSTLGLVAVWLCFLGYVGWAMRQPPEVFGHVMAKMPMPAYFLFPFETMWTQARSGTLQPGDAAPDFTMKQLQSGASVQLASLWQQRPVVLVFGSYT